MRIRNTGGDGEQPRLQMSSMIDVVFLLLIFFVMTFQISAVEGDFQINPARAATEGADRPPPREILFHVSLLTGDDGNLAGVRFDGRRLKNLDELRSLLTTIVAEHVAAGGSRDDLSVELRSEDSLKYQFAIDALTAIRGPDAEQPLIEDIRFRS